MNSFKEHRDLIQFVPVPVSSGGDSAISRSKWFLIIPSSGNFPVKYNINLPCYGSGPLPPVLSAVHIGTLLFPSVLCLHLETVILSVFSKQHRDLSLLRLVPFCRALVTALDGLHVDVDLRPEVDAVRWLNLGVTDVIHGLPSVLYLLVQYLLIFC